jgi:hypothetical protein
VWWYISLIPSLRKLKQDFQFQGSLGYRAKPWLRKPIRKSTCLASIEALSSSPSTAKKKGRGE